MSIDIPSALVAGDSWAFVLGRHDYDPPWSVAVVLVREDGSAQESFPASHDPASGWRVTVGASASAVIAAGPWRWSITATDVSADARVTLASGSLVVRPNPAGGGDLRSEAERHLAAIEATLADPNWIGAENYSIAGRSLARRPVADLLRLRAFWSAQVRRERGLPAIQTIPMRLAR